MSKKNLQKPGEKPRKPAEYVEVGPQGGQVPRHARSRLSRGSELPPTQEPGRKWKPVGPPKPSSRGGRGLLAEIAPGSLGRRTPLHAGARGELAMAEVSTVSGKGRARHPPRRHYTPPPSDCVYEVRLAEVLHGLSAPALMHAPGLLYAAGDLSVLEGTRRVAIVGSRKASAEGVRRARKLASLLAREGVVVVSGLAAGIHQAAHRGALGVDGWPNDCGYRDAARACVPGGARAVAGAALARASRGIAVQGGLARRSVELRRAQPNDGGPLARVGRGRGR